MFERDHLMRQINMLAHALAHALALRAEDRDGEALSHLDRSFLDLTGEDNGSATKEESLVSLSVQPDGRLKPFATDVAAMLTVRGDILAEMGNSKSAVDSFGSALRIYRAALASPVRELPWDINDRIDALKERLQDAGWDDD